MSEVAVKIADDVVGVLKRATVEGNIVRLPGGQLPRQLYVATDKALAALGGKWDRRAGGHVFANDPSEKLATAIGSGKAVDDLLTRKKRLQLFETPASLADRLVAKLAIHSLDVCLEPSAGRGRLVEAMKRAGAVNIAAIEIDADNASEIVATTVEITDFLTATPRATAIAMNPPFTRNQDIRHVRHAYSCLTHGGRLAAIVSEHGLMGAEREAVEWREWLAAVGADLEVIPAGTFRESGTNIQTRMVFIVKGDN